jgi:hypothetical protein
MMGSRRAETQPPSILIQGRIIIHPLPRRVAVQPRKERRPVRRCMQHRLCELRAAPLAIRPPFAMGEKGNLIDLSNPGTCIQWRLSFFLLPSTSVQIGRSIGPLTTKLNQPSNPVYFIGKLKLQMPTTQQREDHAGYGTI